MELSRLRAGDSGDEVARVHEKLKSHGLEVSNEEVKRKFFGPSTREAVAECQKRNALGVTCEVDEATAKALEAPLAKRDNPISSRTSSPATGVSPSAPASGEVLGGAIASIN